MSDVGDLIEGRYRVERKVGSGGMGVVFQATDLLTSSTVAVKVMSTSTDPSIAARARHQREVELLARLHSPHVAKFLAAGYLGDGLPYFVMEFLEGRDLKAEVRRRGQLPCAEAAAYVVQACRGIAVAHRLGIVHRDLKPHNLFLTGLSGARTVKIVDFGVAKCLGSADPGLTATDAAVGTPLYMSPEQLIDARAISTKADVWALGVILYELLAGFSPFADNSPGAVIAAVTLDEAVPIQKVRQDVPDGIAIAIDLALRKQPQDRIGTAEELEQLLCPHATPDALLIVPSDVDVQTQSAIERPARTRVSAFLRDQILAAIDAESPGERATLRCLPTAPTQGSRPLPERLSLVPALRSLTPELPELIGRATASKPAPLADAPKRRGAVSKALLAIAVTTAVPAGTLWYRQYAQRSPVSESLQATSPAQPIQSMPTQLSPNPDAFQGPSPAIPQQVAANAEAAEPATPPTKHRAAAESAEVINIVRPTIRHIAGPATATDVSVAPLQSDSRRIVPRHL